MIFNISHLWLICLFPLIKFFSWAYTKVSDIINYLLLWVSCLDQKLKRKQIQILITTRLKGNLKIKGLTIYSLYKNCQIPVLRHLVICSLTGSLVSLDLIEQSNMKTGQGLRMPTSITLYMYLCEYFAFSQCIVTIATNDSASHYNLIIVNCIIHLSPIFI